MKNTNSIEATELTHGSTAAARANEVSELCGGAEVCWADVRVTMRVRDGSASGRREVGKSGVWECNDLMELLETEPTAQPKISFLLFRLSAEGSGEEPQKMARKFLGLLARSEAERDRGAYGLQCVRFASASPRAPRVAIIVLSRNGFEQRSVFLHRY